VTTPMLVAAEKHGAALLVAGFSPENAASAQQLI
jgi:hypothetical protein